MQEISLKATKRRARKEMRRKRIMKIKKTFDIKKKHKQPQTAYKLKTNCENGKVTNLINNNG